MRLNDVVEIAKALSDPNRIRALLALRNGELCACQLVSLLKLAPSTVSKHMAILRRAGMVESRKSGRWVHFRLASNDDAEAARRWVLEAADDVPEVIADARELEKLKCRNLEELCDEIMKR